MHVDARHGTTVVAARHWVKPRPARGRTPTARAGTSPGTSTCRDRAGWFASGYLGFAEIDRATTITTTGDEAWIGVGFALPNGADAVDESLHVRVVAGGPLHRASLLTRPARRTD